MQSSGSIFAEISQRVFGTDTNFSASVGHPIFFPVCHYYSQYRCTLLLVLWRAYSSAREISSNGRAFASHVRGTGINTQILQSLEGM